MSLAQTSDLVRPRHAWIDSRVHTQPQVNYNCWNGKSELKLHINSTYAIIIAKEREMKNLPIDEDDGNWDEDVRLLFVNTPFFTSSSLCPLYLSLMCPWFAFLSSVSISRSSPVSSILWCYCLCSLVLSVCICSLCVFVWLPSPCLWVCLLSLVRPIFLLKAPHLCAFWFSILCLFLYPHVRISPIST